MPEDFDFETSKVISVVKARKCSRVLLQFPEGLKRHAAGIAAAISDGTDATVIISGEAFFGACDLPTTDADLIVQFGHLPMPCVETKKSVMYIQARSSADPIPAIEAALPMLEPPVGLLTTAQHIHLVDSMRDFIEGKGLKVFVGKGGNRLHAEGQVLGCDASAALAIEPKVKSFLLVGTGMFHALAVALSTAKPVIAADPVGGGAVDTAEARDRLLRQRHAAIVRAGQAKRFGILLSTKPGQRRLELALGTSRMLEAGGRTAALVEMDLITPDKLAAFGLDAWVSTACPRLALDDAKAYPAPVLTPIEAEVLAGKRRWEDYAFDAM